MNGLSNKDQRSDLGGVHAPGTARGRPEGDFPPGVTCYKKEPLDANPLFQVCLPVGFSHEGKRSKGVSFAGDNRLFLKGTTRSQQQAEMACMSWAWMWWDNLSSEERSSLQAGGKEPPCKKRKVWKPTRHVTKLPGVREKEKLMCVRLSYINMLICSHLNINCWKNKPAQGAIQNDDVSARFMVFFPRFSKSKSSTDWFGRTTSPNVVLLLPDCRGSVDPKMCGTPYLRVGPVNETCWSSLRRGEQWNVEGIKKASLMIFIPQIGSMGWTVYLPTFFSWLLYNFSGKWR